jgi:subtilisin family serine protease
MALDRGAQVVNMSLGSQECHGTCDTCPECRAVKLLTRRGVLVFVAAGNSGPDPNAINCQGCTPEAITVAAVDRDGNVADFSSRGGTLYVGKPDIAAPGVNIYSGTGRGSLVDTGDFGAGFGWAAISGTSMATPHAAGLGALVKHRNPGITAAQFKERLRANGAPFNLDTGYGMPRWSWF